MNNVKKFLLKKFPTDLYMDCPVPNSYWEIMQEYADSEIASLNKQSASTPSDAVEEYAKQEAISMLKFMTVEDIKEGKNGRLRKYFTPNGECVAQSYEAMYMFYKNNKPVDSGADNLNEVVKPVDKTQQYYNNLMRKH
jgi:hypothetical protein